MNHLKTFEIFQTNQQLEIKNIAGNGGRSEKTGSMSFDAYTAEVLAEMKKLAIKINLGQKFVGEYLTWFSNTEDFKNMISVEKFNLRTPLRAAESIMSIWR